MKPGIILPCDDVLQNLNWGRYGVFEVTGLGCRGRCLETDSIARHVQVLGNWMEGAIGASGSGGGMSNGWTPKPCWPAGGT